MELSLYESCRKRRLTLTYAMAAFGIALFYAAVCTPVWIWANSNILVAETVFRIVWDVVTTVVNYLFYWVSFAFMLSFFARFTAKNSKSVLFVYLGASAFLYVGNLLAYCFVNGFSDFRTTDLLDVLLNVGLDAAQMAIAALLAWRFFKPSQDRAIQTAGLRGEEIAMPRYLPTESLTNLKNPLQRGALVASGISAGLHIASRIRYDLFYGAPKGAADLVWMISAYLSELIAWVVGYFVILLLLNSLDARETAKKEKYER